MVVSDQYQHALTNIIRHPVGFLGEIGWEMVVPEEAASKTQDKHHFLLF
jgi:hypothetical protein